jgi:hypothetical protein
MGMGRACLRRWRDGIRERSRSDLEVVGYEKGRGRYNGMTGRLPIGYRQGRRRPGSRGSLRGTLALSRRSSSCTGVGVSSFGILGQYHGWTELRTWRCPTHEEGNPQRQVHGEKQVRRELVPRTYCVVVPSGSPPYIASPPCLRSLPSHVLSPAVEVRGGTRKADEPRSRNLLLLLLPAPACAHHSTSPPIQHQHHPRRQSHLALLQPASPTTAWTARQSPPTLSFQFPCSPLEQTPTPSLGRPTTARLYPQSFQRPHSPRRTLSPPVSSSRRRKRASPEWRERRRRSSRPSSCGV